MDSEPEGEEMEEEEEECKWIFTIFWKSAVLISESEERVH